MFSGGLAGFRLPYSPDGSAFVTARLNVTTTVESCEPTVVANPIRGATPPGAGAPAMPTVSDGEVVDAVVNAVAVAELGESARLVLGVHRRVVEGDDQRLVRLAALRQPVAWGGPVCAAAV